MKIINITKTTILSIGLMAFVGCQESLDEININPNQPEQVPTSGLMNSATKELMDATRNDFESGRMTLPWVQYSAQVAYTEEDRFQFRETSSAAIYNNLYRVAVDYQSIIKLNTNPATMTQASAYGNNSNQIAVSRIMLSYIFSILADTFGSVPYYSYGNSDPDFQALNLATYPQPKYASQDKIYSDILKELKESSNQLVLSDNKFDGDPIYNGNMTKWKKFANSLRLRIANRLKVALPEAQSHITDAISSGVMTSNNDNAVLVYAASNPQLASPMYTAMFVNSRTDFKITDTMVKALKGEKGGFGLDPRLYKYAAPVFKVDADDNYILDNSGNKQQNFVTPSLGSFTYTPSKRLDNYIGLPYGLTRQMVAVQNASGASNWSNNVIKPNFGEVLMEYAEVEFLLSEINGWDDNHYKNGVKASMERWGVPTSDINSFVNALPVANQANVLNQKYLALFMQPQEAYAEYRRTGYPNFLLKPGETNNLLIPTTAGATTYVFTPISPAGSTLTEMPARITYPVTLRQYNPNGYNSGVANLGTGGDKLTTKLIWDKN